MLRFASRHWHLHFQVRVESFLSQRRSSDRVYFVLVSKDIRIFGQSVHMASDDVSHFRTVVQTIHHGRLEEMPAFIQGAMDQGLSSLVEKLYETGFMEE